MITNIILQLFVSQNQFDKQMIIFYFVAPSMPINLLAEVINATSVNLTWDEPLMSNGMIRSYTITILDDVMNVVQNQTALNSVMMSIITQLTPNTGYVVNVSAVTVRSGDAASVTFLTPACKYTHTCC